MDSYLVQIFTKIYTYGPFYINGILIGYIYRTHGLGDKFEMKNKWLCSTITLYFTVTLFIPLIMIICQNESVIYYAFETCIHTILLPIIIFQVLFKYSHIIENLLPDRILKCYQDYNFISFLYREFLFMYLGQYSYQNGMKKFITLITSFVIMCSILKRIFDFVYKIPSKILSETHRFRNKVK